MMWLGCLAVLAGCSAVPGAAPTPELGATPWAKQSSLQQGQWHHYALPGKASSQFAYTRKDGRDAMAVTSMSSASMVRKPVRVEPADLGNVRFSWKVPELISQADMALREADDSPVRIVLAFEGDRSRLSQRNAALSELALALTGEEMPYATLMYVWCNKRPAGEIITNPRTDRIRKIVLESGSKNLGQWLDYERDIRTDFIKAFGEEPGALTGIALMTDTDNTQSTATAWYGPVSFTSLPSSKASR